MALFCCYSLSTLIRGTILLLMLALTSRSVTPVVAARITVGDTNNWRFGINYTDWASKTAPFHQNDTLVFKYDPPSNSTFPHNVYLLKNLRSFIACDMKNATMVGSVVQGAGNGLEVVLKKRKPYYFACGVGAGLHCKVGLMKFSVHPIKSCRS